MDKLIYIASPYSAHTPEGSRIDKVEEGRYLETCKACAALMLAGHLVYSPIMHWHVVDMLSDQQIGYEDYLAADCEMIKRCDEVWVLTIDGWDKSKGVAFEVKYAEMHKRPVRYFKLTEEGIVHETKLH